MDLENCSFRSLKPEHFYCEPSKKEKEEDYCSMCGEFCAMRIVSEFLDPAGKADVARS